MQSTCILLNTRLYYVAISCFLVLYPSYGSSQLFPGLEGEVLVEAIQQNYTPNELLTDTQVKDTLYARVFIEEDSVRCIYSGMPRFLPEGVDPSQFLFGTGTGVTDINLEHGWPQAKGAGDGTNGNVDMHHLYPSRVEINSDRGNFPFSDIPDQSTQKWYYLQQVMTEVPSNDIDAYSEFITGNFEPRESVKGDIARAMFYFWTIYREDALDADPQFFDLQKEYLCQWHEEDPADSFEIVRSERIAAYQGGVINPFVIDCSLSMRAYCPELNDCLVVGTQAEQKELAEVYYDHKTHQFMIRASDNSVWRTSVINMMGQIVYVRDLHAGSWSDGVDLPGGFYILLARNKSRQIHFKFFLAAQ